MRLGRALMVMSVVLVAGVAIAGHYEYQPSPRDLDDLDHSKAYRWGIDTGVPADETVVAASIFFDNIRNWNKNDPNDLYVTLLDSAPAGVTIYTDNQGGGDFFAGQGLLLVHYHNLSHIAQDITYPFDETELAALNDAIADDGNFGLGFDPDCHYWNCGITMRLETEEEPHGGPPIPEPLAGSILLGGIGMILARRRRR